MEGGGVMSFPTVACLRSHGGNSQHTRRLNLTSPFFNVLLLEKQSSSSFAPSDQKRSRRALGKHTAASSSSALKVIPERRDKMR